jgi:hypothetical protein
MTIYPNRGWVDLTNNVQFPFISADIPKKIKFSNVRFDGSGNLRVINITNRFFTFSVSANGGKNKRGIRTVSFDWEAIF